MTAKANTLVRRVRVGVGVVVLAAASVAWGQSAVEKPAAEVAGYRSDEVTGYLSLDLAGIEKSRALAALMGPEAMKKIQAGRAEIRQGINMALGVNAGDVDVDSMQGVLFANDLKQFGGVIRGQWNAGQLNDLLRAAEAKIDAKTLKLTYGEHQVVCLSGATASGIKGLLTERRENGGSKVSMNANGDEVYLSVHEKGPLLLATGMTSMGRLLDALDKDPLAGESKFVPGDALVAKTTGHRPLVSFWLKDIPTPTGASGRESLPGPLKGLTAVSLAVWETEEAVTVAGGVSMPTQDDAFRLKTMAEGAMLIASSQITDKDVKSILGAVRTGVDGSTMRVEWVWPMARMDQLKGVFDKAGGRARGEVNNKP